MNRKQKRLVRLVAIVLAALLGMGAVISALLSFAYAEEALPAEDNQCAITIEYLPEEQALRMSQRLVYTNASGRALDRVIFYAPANLFRRQSSLPYEGDAIAEALPEGYLPGGIDLANVRVNGEKSDWGFQGENEMYLRVACDLEPGESCAFEFDYYLLLTRNAAFLGISDDHWRLSDFYFAPANLGTDGEFTLNGALAFARYADVPAMDFSVGVQLPEQLMLAASGSETVAENGSSAAIWEIRAENVHDFALIFGSSWRKYDAETASGVQLRLLSGVKKTADRVLETAVRAIEACEEFFGSFPFRQIDIVQAELASGSLNHSACLWLDEDILKAGGREMEHAVYRFIAQQYFGRSAWASPAADAWLSDSVSEYIAYLLLEEEKGHDAYLAALNDEVVPALQLTIPGGLNVTSDAGLFTAYEYDIVVRSRGAAVFHELRTAMGREELIQALGLFYRKGLQADVLTEMDLAGALEEASGRSWQKFLTDWLFNIGDYVNQDIDWLD